MITDDGVSRFLTALGKRVRMFRLARALTQAELADASGMSRSFVSLIETGQHPANLVRLLHIASALDVPLDVLLSDRFADVALPSLYAADERVSDGLASAVSSSRQIRDQAR